MDWGAYLLDVVAVASVVAIGGRVEQDEAVIRLMQGEGYVFHGRAMRTLWFVWDGFQASACQDPGWRAREAGLLAHPPQAQGVPASSPTAVPIHPGVPATTAAGSTAEHWRTRHTLAIFAVAGEEQRYIVEWVLYHLALGVDTIYIYDNEDEPTYHLLFAQQPQVVVIHVRVTLPHRPVMAHFMDTYKHRHTWACHLDVDEFLNLRPGAGFRSVKDFLQHHIPVGGVVSAGQLCSRLKSRDVRE